MADIAHTAETHRLEGSSPPNGEPPSFKPVGAPAPNPHDHRVPSRSAEQRLEDLNARYRLVLKFSDAASDQYNNIDLDRETRDSGELANGHACRILRQMREEAYAVPATTIRALGLKARILSESKRTWWNANHNDEDRDARFLIEDVLAMAGMDRIHPRDEDITFLLPGYTGPSLRNFVPYSEPTKNATPLPPGASLGRTVAALLRKHDELEKQWLDLEGTEPAKLVARQRMDQISRRVKEIEHNASFTPAASLEDALFQVLLLYGEVDTLDSYVDNPIPKINQGDHEELVDRINRLLWSIRGALEVAAGMQAEDVGARYYMTRWNDADLLDESAAA